MRGNEGQLKARKVKARQGRGKGRAGQGNERIG
jgi:hypothetical protein